MNKWKLGVILGMIGLYILGIVSGVALYHLRQQRRLAALLQKPTLELRERFLMRTLTFSLSLSKTQRQRIAPLARQLIHQRTPHVEAFQRNTFPYRRKFLLAIQPMLRPKQRKAWERLFQKYGKAPLPHSTPPR